MWNDLNHIIRVKWMAYLLQHSVVQYHNEMNNRVEQTQNWELRLNLLPLLLQRWNKNEAMNTDVSAGMYIILKMSS